MGWKKRRIERLLEEREAGPSPQTLQAGLVHLSKEVQELQRKLNEFLLERDTREKELKQRIEKLEKGRIHELIDGSDSRVALKAIERFEARLLKAGIPDIQDEGSYST